MKKNLIWLMTIAFLSVQCSYSQNAVKKEKMEDNGKKNTVFSKTDTSKVDIPDEQWKNILSPEVFYVGRMKGTERPWTSKYEKFNEKGTYYCAACGNALFQSDTKFDSGCGWPSFYQPISKTSIIYLQDNTLGMTRTEVQCGRCKSHLGHVFDDGPPPTGLRYCINGVILDFDKAQETEKKYKKEKG